MKYELKPEEVSHEAILAIKLHEQVLAQEFTRITKTARGREALDEREIFQASERIKQKMLDCEEAREQLEKWFPEDRLIGDIIKQQNKEQ